MRTHTGAAFALAVFFTVLFAGCASARPAPTNVFSGGEKSHANMRLSFYPGADGSRLFRLEGAYPSGAALTGTVADQPDGGYALSVTGFEWFGNWVDGWTEAKFIAGGSLRVSAAGGSWTLSAETPVAIESPTWAKIRYRDTIIDPETATAQLTNRWDRVVAVSAFLAEKNVAYAGSGKNAQKTFAASARKILFPELYGYLPNATKGSPKDWVLDEGVLWDTAYTNATFPEALRDIRNTGTVLRDWEEGFDLFLIATRQTAIPEGTAIPLIVKKSR